MRRHVLQLQVDELEILKASQPQLSEPARAAIDAKIASYKDHEKQLTSEPDTGEGLDELFRRARRSKQSATWRCARDPYFRLRSGVTPDRDRAGLDRHHLGRLDDAARRERRDWVWPATLLTLNGFTLAVSLPLLG